MVSIDAATIARSGRILEIRIHPLPQESRFIDPLLPQLTERITMQSTDPHKCPVQMLDHNKTHNAIGNNSKHNTRCFTNLGIRQTPASPAFLFPAATQCARLSKHAQILSRATSASPIFTLAMPDLTLEALCPLDRNYCSHTLIMRGRRIPSDACKAG